MVEIIEIGALPQRRLVRHQPFGGPAVHRVARRREHAFLDSLRGIAREEGIGQFAIIGADRGFIGRGIGFTRSEEHTSELQSLMRISYAVFCLKKKTSYKLSQTYIYQTS